MTPDPAPRLIADRLDKTCKVDLDYVYLRHSQWAELRDAIFAALPVAPTPDAAPLTREWLDALIDEIVRTSQHEELRMRSICNRLRDAILAALSPAAPCPTNHMYFDEDGPGWWRYWKDDGETECPECGAALSPTPDDREES